VTGTDNRWTTKKTVQLLAGVIGVGAIWAGLWLLFGADIAARVIQISSFALVTLLLLRRPRQKSR
jgi:hypothetical protein